jgi:hypothetical protein
MKLIIGTALVLLLAGAPGYARQEPDQDKPKEEPKKQEAPKKGEQPKKTEAPKEQPNRARQEQEKPAEKPKQEPARQENGRNKAQQTDRAQEQERARQTEQHTAQQHQVEQHQAEQHNGHENGRRIPEEKFHASFGSSHHFHVERSNDRRFQYGGYYFNYSEPWPSDWAYTDDVYIDYIDGEYYLIDPRHPGIRLLVVIGD